MAKRGRPKGSKNKVQRSWRCCRCGSDKRTYRTGCHCRECKAAVTAIYRARLKSEVLEQYGGSPPRCQCPGGCQENLVPFLCIDHIHGSGVKHRASVGRKGGWGFYGWLRERKFPQGFRVLCHNCNQGRQINGGRCPHEDK